MSTTEKKIQRLNWRIVKLQNKIAKQEALLANFRLYHKEPAFFYITNLANWQNKLGELQRLRDYYLELKE